MLHKSLTLVMLLLLMTGCATYQNTSLQRMETLPEHYNHFDAKLAWEVKSVANATVISGVIENIRYYEMGNIEVWVSSLDANGKEVHRGVDFVFSLKQNEANSFTVKIPRVAPGTTLQFLYRYIGFNGDSDPDAVTWSQSFEAKVP